MRQRKPYPKGRVSAMPGTAQALDLKAAVIQALEDDRYDWRTVGGIARALAVKNHEVIAVLKSLSSQVVRTTTDDGQAIFTTRNHYEKTHGFGDKLLSALADKVVA